MKKTLAEVAKLIQAELIGEPDFLISGVATLKSADRAQLSFFHNPLYQRDLESTMAGVVILTKATASFFHGQKLIVDDPYFAYSKVAHLFEFQSPQKRGVHPTAIIGERCAIASGASIGPYVVIEDDVSVGEGTIIGAHSVVGSGVKIGSDCRIDARVTLYHHISIGNRVVILSGSVIGSDGFGNAFYQGRWYRVPQLGSVVVEDDVEIGANTTIDRGAIEDTIIRTGARLDNQIQIGHNVDIGEHTALAGCVGVAGSVTIGKYCMIGGGSGIAGHLQIADQVMLTGMASVSGSIKEKGVYSSGTAHMPMADWKKNVARFRQLDKLARKVNQLESVMKKKEGEEK